MTVDATPLLNETDTTNGYTMGAQQIEEVPLGTGSFTQLAILAPGVNADFLSGSGSNEGLGNQGIVANGQRDTSNLFTFNGVNANNLFNGNSTSNISDSRFTLNTGEIFGVGGQVQTNSCVFDAIGQALPTPPVETIQEVHVSTSMYNASMGSASGAHIETTTKSGSNNFHGQVYEYFQNNVADATPTFLAPIRSSPARRRSTATFLAQHWAARSRKTRCFSLARIRASESATLSAVHLTVFPRSPDSRTPIAPILQHWQIS